MNKIKIYKVIFSLGYQNDEESLLTGQRGDVLIMDENGAYYDPFFVTLKRIEGEFQKNNNCYLSDKLVILHSVTKENILKSIPEIHNWLFQKRWNSLDEKKIEEFYYPKEDWVFFDVKVNRFD